MRGKVVQGFAVGIIGLYLTVGCIDASTLYPPPTRLYALVLINGENVTLVGSGPRDSGKYPPALNDLELCGGPSEQPPCEGPYQLTLFAVPEN
jgi:hypothetical protein